MLRAIRIERKAQFFLIAALVIIGIVAGLGVVYNFMYNAGGEEKEVYTLSEELNFETSQVMHQAIYRDISPDEQDEQIKELVAFYARTHPESDFVIYYGNKVEGIKMISYEAKDCLESGGNQ